MKAEGVLPPLLLSTLACLALPVTISGASPFLVDQEGRLAIISNLGPEGLERLFCTHGPEAVSWQLCLTGPC